MAKKMRGEKGKGETREENQSHAFDFRTLAAIVI